MGKKKSMRKRIRNIILFTLTSCLSISTLGCKEPAVQTVRVNAVSSNVGTDLLIHPDHIIFLWLENKGFNSIIGNLSAPFMNSLVKKGTLFTNSYAITHPSYPNYVDFFAGQTNGITSNACIDNSTLATPNLYTILKDVGKSFAWYSEDLPTTGSKVCTYNNYVQKHNPTTLFANVPGSANKRFADFPTDYNQLENVVGISPNMVNDMHDGTINQADTWLEKYLAPLVDWCTTHNSVFVIYFDESESKNDNRIPVIAVGQQVKEAYRSDTRYDHYSWTKTISAMFFAPDAWTGNLSAAKLVTGCWK
jgi:phosphatidylinositol-3-phosphatase